MGPHTGAVTATTAATPIMMYAQTSSSLSSLSSSAACIDTELKSSVDINKKEIERLTAWYLIFSALVFSKNRAGLRSPI